MIANKLFLYRFIDYKIYFKDEAILFAKKAYNIF